MGAVLFPSSDHLLGYRFQDMFFGRLLLDFDYSSFSARGFSENSQRLRFLISFQVFELLLGFPQFSDLGLRGFWVCVSLLFSFLFGQSIVARLLLCLVYALFSFLSICEHSRLLVLGRNRLSLRIRNVRTVSSCLDLVSCRLLQLHLC